MINGIGSRAPASPLVLSSHRLQVHHVTDMVLVDYMVLTAVRKQTNRGGDIGAQASL